MAVNTIERLTPGGRPYYTVIRDESGSGVFIAYSSSLIIKHSGIITRPQKNIPVPISGVIKVLKHNAHAYHKTLMAYNRQRLHVGATLQLDIDNLYNLDSLYLDSLDCIDTI